MAKRSKSGLKHKRQSERRRLANQAVLSRLKTLTKAARTNPEKLAQAVSELDRAARKGIIHHNTAARTNSRLMTKLTTGTPTPASPARGGARENGKAGAKATP